jgi:hypothetical protein
MKKPASIDKSNLINTDHSINDNPKEDSSADDINHCIAFVGSYTNKKHSAKPCSSSARHGRRTCGKHEYYDALTEEQHEQIKAWIYNNDETGDVKFCYRGHHYVFGENRDSKIIQRCSKCKITDPPREYLHSTYKKSARVRGIEFNLSKQQVTDLVSKNCHYCDEMNDKGVNGIDRIDNDIGYIIDNSVPCCTVCNYMKGELSKANFIGYCKNILANYPNKDPYPPPTDKLINKKISAAKAKCLKKNRKFNMSFAQVKSALSFKCRYCGNTNSDVRGLDRVDPKSNYDDDKVVACCKICNFIKEEFTFEVFFHKVELISARF